MYNETILLMNVGLVAESIIKIIITRPGNDKLSNIYCEGTV